MGRENKSRNIFPRRSAPPYSQIQSEKATQQHATAYSDDKGQGGPSNGASGCAHRLGASRGARREAP